MQRRSLSSVGYVRDMVGRVQESIEGSRGRERESSVDPLEFLAAPSKAWRAVKKSEWPAGCTRRNWNDAQLWRLEKRRVRSWHQRGATGRKLAVGRRRGEREESDETRGGGSARDAKRRNKGQLPYRRGGARRRAVGGVAKVRSDVSFHQDQGNGRGVGDKPRGGQGLRGC